MDSGGLMGFVANFAQEVMKGQWPRSVEGLGGQRVELFGRSEALVSRLCRKLPKTGKFRLANH